MPTIQVEAQLSPQELLVAVEQLSLPELETFLDIDMVIRAHRIAPALSPTETDLLKQINEPISPEILARFEELRKQQTQTKEELSPEAEAELYDLINQIETATAERIQNLATLAQLRGKTVEELMRDLEIKPRHDG